MELVKNAYPEKVDYWYTKTYMKIIAFIISLIPAIIYSIYFG